MTTRTAAEALEEMRRGFVTKPHGTYLLCRGCGQSWWENDTSPFGGERHNFDCWFVAAYATLRAALAPPQEGEVEECAKAMDNLALKWPMRVEASLMQRAARLLRATQSNGHSPDTGSVSDGLRVAEADSRKVEPATSVKENRVLVSGESPAQSAPAHDALAGQTNNGRPKQPRSISEGREVEAWKYYLDGCWHVCLDEDSDEHIRENGIALSTHEYRWEWK